MDSFIDLFTHLILFLNQHTDTNKTQGKQVVSQVDEAYEKQPRKRNGSNKATKAGFHWLLVFGAVRLVKLFFLGFLFLSITLAGEPHNWPDHWFKNNIHAFPRLLFQSSITVLLLFLSFSSFTRLRSSLWYSFYQFKQRKYADRHTTTMKTHTSVAALSLSHRRMM